MSDVPPSDLSPADFAVLVELNAGRPVVLKASGKPYVMPYLYWPYANAPRPVVSAYRCDKYGSAACVCVTGFRNGKNFGPVRTVKLAGLAVMS
jgi:hypothetical protein